MRLLLSLIFSLCTGLPRTVYAEKQTITWGFSDIKNLTGKAYARAIGENHPLFLILKKNLPDYNHEVFYGTATRIENELKQRALTCFPASTTADGRAGFAYSTPVSVYEAPMLVVRKDMAEKFHGKTGSLSLAKIVQDKDMEGVLIESRYYGNSIDKILGQAKASIHRRVLAPIGTNTIQMVASKRGDYTVEYAFLVDSLREQGKLSSDLFIASIEEEPIALPVYVACSRTPEGLKVTQRIDEIIRKNVTTPEYREAMLHEKNASRDYEKAVDRFIKSRAKNSEVH